MRDPDGSFQTESRDAVSCRLAPRVAMVQTTQARMRNHRRLGCRLLFDRAAIRRILFQGIVNPVVVIVAHVVADQSAEVLFVPGDAWSKISRRTLPTHLSAIPFCHGAWTLVRFGSSPVAFKNAITSASNFESWSRITYRYGEASGNASRNCWTTQSAVGCWVTLQCRILLRPRDRKPDRATPIPEAIYERGGRGRNCYVSAVQDLREPQSSNVLRKNRLATAASRFAVSRKSMVCPVESTARYR